MNNVKQPIQGGEEGPENNKDNTRKNLTGAPHSVSPSVIRALVKALATSGDADLPKSLEDIAASITGARATNNPVVELLAYLVNKSVRDDLGQRACLTNDIVDIEGGFPHKRFRELRVNSQKVRPDRREFVLLYILGHHALKNWSQGYIPAEQSARFMPVDEILVEIGNLKAAHPDLRDLWLDSDPKSIHQVVRRLRKKLIKAKLNPFLIECGESGAGVRLSTRPGQIRLIFHPADGRQSAD